MGPGESEQLHDFNPGDLNEPGLPDLFSAGGVFWTSPVPERAVGIHPGMRVPIHPISSKVYLAPIYALVSV